MIACLLWFPISAQNKIIGKVIAADNKDIIFQVKVEETNLSKAITGSFYNQNFEIASDSLGEIQVIISSDGYDTFQLRKMLQPGINDLGEIVLYKKAVQLGEVVVRTKKSEIVHDGGDYTIRNIQGTHIGDAGNLVDMLKWTPGIIVANENDITVVGAGEAIIYINDRKITNRSELSTLSSTDVSKIEVIKEPDARYKNGTNAVVKIYLKKQLKDFLGVTASNSLSITRKYTESPSINLSGKSGIVSGNASFTYRKSKQKSYDESRTYITHSADNFFKNNSKGKTGTDMDSYIGFGGLNFSFSPKSTLGIQYSGFSTSVEKDMFHNINIDNNGDNTLKNSASEETENRKSHSASASYTWKRNEYSILNLIADYAYRDYYTDGETKEINLSTNKTYVTPTSSATNYKIYTFNGDYSFKIGQKDNEQIGIEAGSTDNKSSSTISGALQNIDRTNQWGAAYGTFRRTWGKINSSLGLRYEYDYTDTKAIKNGTSITLKKVYSNLFPNARISYKRKEGESYTLNYQQGIHRPLFDQLSPVVYYLDSLNYYTGNPLLKPSFTNSMSLTANLSKLTLRASYYYTTNPIVSIYEHTDENPNILITSPKNIDHSQSWEVGAEYSLSQSKIIFSSYAYLTGEYCKYPYLGKETLYKSLFVNMGGNVGYNFYRNFNIFANIIYMSPRRENTMKRDYFLRTDIGISRSFYKNKLYVSVQGNDLFAKGVASCYTNNYGDTEHWWRGRYDTRGVNFTLRYTFNSVKTNFRSKSGNDNALRRTD
jgi:hypothetical protein